MRLAILGDRDNAQQFADAAGRLVSLAVVGAYDDMETLLRAHNDDADAVLILANSANSCESCRCAVKAGKPVLLEAESLGQASQGRELVEMAGESGVQLVISPAHRFHPSVRSVKDSLNAGELGEPGLLRIHRWQSSQEPNGKFVSSVADLDLAIWFFGTLPSEIYCQGKKAGAGNSNPSTYLQIHLGFPGGGMALIYNARTLPPDDDYYSLSLIGSSGAAYADDHHDTQLLYAGGKASAFKAWPNAHQIVAQLEEFEATIDGGADTCSDEISPLLALDVAEHARLSMSEGRAVRLNGDTYEIA